MNSEIHCPSCRTVLTEMSNSLFCPRCKLNYPIHDGITMLVPELDGHLKKIDEKVEQSNKWYVSEQVKHYDNSPYKFDLEKRIEFVKHIVEDYFRDTSKQKKILDLGCGDGANIRWLSKFTDNLWATDYNLIRLRRAVKISNELKIKARFFLIDILHSPFAEESFDLIFFNHVIEHIKEDKIALQNIYHFTKKGGIVIVGTPNEGAIFWKFAYFIEPMIKKKTDHVHFYTAESFSKLAKSVGFKVKHVEFIGWGLPIFRINYHLKKYRIANTILEHIGRRLFKQQSDALYIILEK